MQPIQTDLTDQALVTAIRANLCEFFRHLYRINAQESVQNSRFTRWHSHLQHPWFNGVLSSSLPEEGDEAFIEETIRYFRSRNIGSFTWWIDPPLQCADWEPLLSKHGFGFSTDTPGMAADLQLLQEPTETVDGLEVRVVADEEALRAWAHVFTLGYGLPADWEPAIFELGLQLGLGFPIRNYLAYWNGKPVSTSCLFLGAGVAGIYSVSTLPEARGKGIGAAVTLRPLQNALEMGYQIGVLQSSEMGFNIYRKLGFRHLCQIEYFHRKSY